MGTHRHEPLEEVNLIMVIPFNRPAMMAISLPGVQTLTETVVLMSG